MLINIFKYDNLRRCGGMVDAPDSKSGHFGGVGSIPSTPTK